MTLSQCCHIKNACMFNLYCMRFIENRGKKRQQRLLLSTVSQRTGTTEGRLCKHRQPLALLDLVSVPHTIKSCTVLVGSAIYDHTMSKLPCLLFVCLFLCLAWQMFISNGPSTQLNKIHLKIITGSLVMIVLRCSLVDQC